MKKATLLFLMFAISKICAQNIESIVNLSPNKKSEIITKARDIEDSNIELEYWLITNKKDTILLTAAIIHDDPPPIVFWDKASEKVIYEERLPRNESKIKIYDIQERAVIFETNGLVGWNEKKCYDQGNGSLLFFRHANGTKAYELMVLDIESKKIKKIISIETSGDPITGTPQIEEIDKVKRKLILQFENTNYKLAILNVEY